MTQVNLFTHRGLVAAPITISNRDNADSQLMLEQPYLAAEVLDAGPQPVSSSPVTSTAYTSLLRVEVEEGRAIRYEINPPARAIAASQASPRLTGARVFHFRAGWTISVIEA